MGELVTITEDTYFEKNVDFGKWHRFYPIDNYSIPREIKQISSEYMAILLPISGQYHSALRPGISQNGGWCGRATSAMLYNYRLVIKNKSNQKDNYIKHWVGNRDDAKAYDIRCPNGKRAFVGENFLNEKVYPELPDYANANAGGWDYRLWVFSDVYWQKRIGDKDFQKVFGENGEKKPGEEYGHFRILNNNDRPPKPVGTMTKKEVINLFNPVVEKIKEFHPVVMLNSMTRLYKGNVSRHWNIISGYFIINDELWLLIADPYDPDDTTRGDQFTSYPAEKLQELNNDTINNYNHIYIIKGIWNEAKPALYLYKACKLLDFHPQLQSRILGSTLDCYPAKSELKNVPSELIDASWKSSFTLPLQVSGRGKASPLSYYYNSEKDYLQINKGGYFPIGMNRAYHGGIHLDAAGRTEDLVPVCAMAKGYIVAARLISSSKAVEEIPGFNELKEILRNDSISFILIRHELYETNGENKDPEIKPLYALYMHLAQPAKPEEYDSGPFAGLNWIKKISNKYRLINIDHQDSVHIGTVSRVKELPADIDEEKTFVIKATEDQDKAFEFLKEGKIITYSKSFLEVENGEVIGFIDRRIKSTGNYLHWEIFAPDDSADTITWLTGLNSNFTFTSIEEKTYDNYCGADEIQQVFKEFKNDEDKSIPSENDLAKDLKKKEEKLDGLDISGYQKKLKKVYEDSDFLFKAKIKADRSNLGLFSDDFLSNTDAYITLLRYTSNNSSNTEIFYPKDMKIPMFEELIKNKLSGGSDSITKLMDFYKKDEEEGKYILIKTEGISALESVFEEANFNPKKIKLNELKNGVEIYLPGDADAIEVSADGCFFSGKMEISNREKRDAFFNKITTKNLRHIHLKHNNEWSPAALKELITTIEQQAYSVGRSAGYPDKKPPSENERVKKSFAKIFPLTWYGRKKAGETDHDQTNKLGEVPMIEDISLFQSGSQDNAGLPPDSAIHNLHPVTLSWLLELLSSDGKLMVKRSWDIYKGQGENNAVYVNWWFYNNTGKLDPPGTYPAGKKLFVLVIGENLLLGGNQQLKIKNTDSGKEFLLSDIFYYSGDGIFRFEKSISCWGRWNLFIDSQESKHPVLFNKPAIPQCKIETLIIKDSGPVFAVNVVLNKNEPNKPGYLEGFIYLKYLKHPKDDKEKKDEKSQWNLFDYALPCYKENKNANSINIKVSAGDIFSRIMNAEKMFDDENSVIDLKAGFFCPNGGFLNLQSEKIQKHDNLDNDDLNVINAVSFPLSELQEKCGDDFLVSFKEEEFIPVSYQLLKTGFKDFDFSLSKDNLNITVSLSGNTIDFNPFIYRIDDKNNQILLSSTYNAKNNTITAVINLTDECYSEKNGFTEKKLKFVVKTPIGNISELNGEFEVKTPELIQSKSTVTTELLDDKDGIYKYRFTFKGYANTLPTDNYMTISIKQVVESMQSEKIPVSVNHSYVTIPGSIFLSNADDKSNTGTGFFPHKDNKYKLQVSEGTSHYGNCDGKGYFEAYAFLNTDKPVKPGEYRFYWYHVRDKIWRFPKINLNRIYVDNT